MTSVWEKQSIYEGNELAEAVKPMLFWCCANVVDGGPTSKRYCVVSVEIMDFADAEDKYEIVFCEY